MSESQAELAKESILETLLRSLSLTLGFAVGAFPLMHTSTLTLSAFMVFVMAIVGSYVARSKVRSWVLGLLVVLTLILVRPLSFGLFSLFGGLGLSATTLIEEVLSLGVLGAALAFSLRSISTRVASLRILELITIALAFSMLVVAHRNGAINRPFAIADPLISVGKDPTIVFVTLGAVGFSLLAIYLISERNIIKSVSVFLIACLAMLMLAAIGLIETPDPGSADSIYGRYGSKGDKGGKGKKGDKKADGNGKKGSDDPLRQPSASKPRSEPVAIVVFDEDYEPPNGYYYFRQGAFSQYNGRRLVPTTKSGVDEDLATHFPSSAYRTSLPELDPSRTKVSALYATLGDTSAPPALVSGVEYKPEPNPNPSRFRYVYRATSWARNVDDFVLSGDRVGEGTWSKEVVDHYTRSPEDPRYQKLAKEIIRDRLTPEARELPVAQAFAIIDWLGKNGKYTLRNEHASEEDPLASFTFGNLTGYCVHFSHSAVTLMRTLGIPARVGTGFAVEASRRSSGTALLVVSGDSHAWPEIYVEGVGWVVLDVEVQTILDGGGAQADHDLQQLLAELLRGNQAKPPTFSESAEALSTLDQVFRFLKAHIFALLGGFILLVLVVLYTAKSSLYLLASIAKGRAQARLYYRYLNAKLSSLGHRRQRGETREAFARRMIQVASGFEHITDELVAQHFGAATTRDHAITCDSLATQLKQSREAIKESHSLGRRILAFLDPLSWAFGK